MGFENTAPSFAETVIGAYSTIYSPSSNYGDGLAAWNPSDRLFTVGNGSKNFLSGNISRSNALVVEKNGNLTISGNAFKPGGGAWTATSDARLKQDVKKYTDGLNKVLAINPVTYYYNKLSGNDTTKEHVGVIAQELQKTVPYMIGSFTKNGTEYLNVDNSSMTYMLVNAIKELNNEIQNLKAHNKELNVQNIELSVYKIKVEEQTKRLEQLERTVLALMENGQTKSKDNIAMSK